MGPGRRRAYLAAMGVPLWRARSSNEQSWSVEETGHAQPVSPPDEATSAGTRDGRDWQALGDQVAGCVECSELAETRTQTVFGVGSHTADLVVIGEAPGAEEDRKGEPFVGRAGQLLDEMLRAIGLDRTRVYIANILKCRPPRNRDPQPEEVANCEPYLKAQLELLAPRVILAVGRVAAQNLLKTDTALGRLRGRVHTYGPDNVPVVVSYHPAYLLRNPIDKRKAWEDLRFANGLLAGSEARQSPGMVSQ